MRVAAGPFGYPRAAFGQRRDRTWAPLGKGRNLNRPVDKDNHAIDAVRYVCLNLLTTHRRGVYHLA